MNNKTNNAQQLHSPDGEMRGGLMGKFIGAAGDAGRYAGMEIDDDNATIRGCDKWVFSRMVP